MPIYFDTTRTDTLTERRVTLTYKSTGLPVDLDDVTEIIQEIRFGSKKGEVVSSLDKTDMTIADPATGQFIIPQIESLNWKSGVYYQDIRLVIDGVRITPDGLKSTFKFDQNVSNPTP